MSNLARQVRGRYLKVRRDYEISLLKEKESEIVEKIPKKYIPKEKKDKKIKKVELVSDNKTNTFCDKCAIGFKTRSGFLSHQRAGKCKKP